MFSIEDKMEKGIARAYLAKHNVMLGMKHYDIYLERLRNYLLSEEGNRELQAEISASEREYNEVLFTEARDAFNAQKWIRMLNICNKLLANKFEESSLYKFLSFCYKNLEQKDLALEFMLKYNDAAKNDEEAPKLLAEAYSEADCPKYYKIALDLIQQVIDKDPKNYSHWMLKGVIYAKNGLHSKENFYDKLRCFEKALELKPNDKAALFNLVLTHAKERHYKEVNDLYKQILPLYEKTMNHQDFFNYAAHLLRSGDYENGWKYYEYRLTDPTSKQEQMLKTLKQERWDGVKDISNSTLLVYNEQGFGDNVLFIRLVKEVQKLCKKVIAVVPEQLFSFFSESDLGFDICPSNVDYKTLKFDYYIALISLPMALKLKKEEIPLRGNYLHVHKDRKEMYAKAFIPETTKFKIGINLEGGEKGKEQNRDIDWKYIEEFAKIDDVQLYIINKDKVYGYYKEAAPNVDFVYLGGTIKSFADTAAAIENMDMIISTDNVILNIAGAVGVKTIALLNFDYEYRWYNAESGKVPWYDSVTSFVNEHQNEWDDNIKKAVQFVKDYMKECGR